MLHAYLGVNGSLERPLNPNSPRNRRNLNHVQVHQIPPSCNPRCYLIASSLTSAAVAGSFSDMAKSAMSKSSQGASQARQSFSKAANQFKAQAKSVAPQAKQQSKPAPQATKAQMQTSKWLPTKQSSPSTLNSLKNKLGSISNKLPNKSSMTDKLKQSTLIQKEYRATSVARFLATLKKQRTCSRTNSAEKLVNMTPGSGSTSKLGGVIGKPNRISPAS